MAIEPQSRPWPVSKPAPPDASAWQHAMRRGDFPEAWAIADRILARNVADGPCWHRPRHEQWIWDGRPLEGRVLVRCYHGLGDTLQFARFFPRLDHATIWAQPALIPLLHTLPGSRSLLPLHDGTPEVDFDVDIESMELAHALRITVDALPGPIPYFNVRPARRFSRAFSVGLVSASGAWNSQRSIPEHALNPLRNDHWQLFNLQLSPIPDMPDISSADVLTLASRIRALDLVISVDTMVAHLAGALGVPTWTLLPSDADWRWMLDRPDTPWYPTMRLFRQPAAGDWDSVIDCVRQALAESTR